MTKEAILFATEKIFDQFAATCNMIDEPVFFTRPNGKWSVAEDIQHLIISTNTSLLAYSLPRFMVRLIGGKPNRPPITYEELMAKYYKKLEDGAKASGRFIPKPIEIKYGKEKLLTNWQRAGNKFLIALKNNRTENDLDNYLIKHPLLGKITLRELCYFTIFHTEHHLNSILKRTSTQA